MDPPIAIGMITGHADIPMTVQAVKAEAVELLTKPFRDQLLVAVQQAIDRNRAVREQRAELVEWRRRYDALTTREHDVMTLVVTGLPGAP